MIPVKPIRGIKCAMKHSSDQALFSGPLLDHFKEHHPEVYSEIKILNNQNSRHLRLVSRKGTK